MQFSKKIRKRKQGAYRIFNNQPPSNAMCAIKKRRKIFRRFDYALATMPPVKTIIFAASNE